MRIKREKIKICSVAAAMMFAVLMFAANVSAVSLNTDAGATGKVTISKAGSEFTAYKILDAEVPAGGGAYEWSYTEAFKEFESVKNAKNEKYSIDKISEIASGAEDSEVKEASVDDSLAPALVKYALDKKITGTTLVNGENTLTPGYYLIRETATLNSENNGYTIPSKPMLISVPQITEKDGEYDYTYDFTVEVKDTEMSFSKTAEESENSYQDAVEKQVGTEYIFRLKSTVPVYNANYSNIVYKISDTMSKGLTFAGEDKVAVYHDSVGDANKIGSDKYSFEQTANADGTTELLFDFSDHSKDETNGTDYFSNVKNYSRIIVTYKASVNKDAVIGVSGNPNTAQVEFTTDPTDTSGANTTKIEDKAKTFTGGIRLTKTDEEGNTLKGAEFTVYSDEDCRKEAKLITYKVTSTKDKNGNDISTVSEEVNDDLSARAAVDDTGVVKFSGLGKGTYYIKETKAPDDYVILKDAIKLEVGVDLPGTIESGEESAVFTYTISGGGVSEGNAEVDSDGIGVFHIKNTKGFILPKTGGSGTVLFVAGGIAVILAAAALFVLSRKHKCRTGAD